MSETVSAGQIVENSRKAGKTYEFDEAHNENTPADIWFQESDEGQILFLVFYSQACRWSQCLSCNLPSKMSRQHIGYAALMAQTDHLFRNPEVSKRCDSIRKVIVSNNGSILDQATLSSTALVYLLAKLNLHMPNLTVVSFETRPEFVDIAELEFINRVLGEGNTPTHLEITIGFEAFDDHIRNDVYHKGLSLETFEQLVQKLAPYGYGLKCYFMQKPVPDMTDAEAVADIRDAIKYLGRIAAEHQIAINLHLNPTYVATGTMLEKAFRERRYAPPLLHDVAAAVRHARDESLSVFIGLTTEGLVVEGGSPIRQGDEDTVEKLERFNRTQDYDILDRICEAGDGSP